MAIVNGTAGKDLVHVAGDGTIVPPGFTEIALATSARDIILAGTGDDIVVAGAGGDVVDGGGGRDMILGGDGDDTLAGGDGDDVMTGGAGADTFLGGAGIDTVSYADAPDSTPNLTIRIGLESFHGDAQGDVIGEDVENVIGSAFHDLIEGSAAGNVLTGLGGFDILVGFGGNDRLYGGDGDDSIEGGTGADRLDGGAGRDIAQYFDGGTVAVIASLASGRGYSGDARGDVYVGIEGIFVGNDADNRLTGSAGGDALSVFGSGDDILDGLAGDDTLRGGAGDDLLRGGAGADHLVGAEGADTFVYAATGDSGVGAGADEIQEFRHAEGDRIDLSAVDANTLVAGNQAFTFIGGQAYHKVAGELRFAVVDGRTTIAGDVNGDGVSDFHIVLRSDIPPIPQATDFVL